MIAQYDIHIAKAARTIVSIDEFQLPDQKITFLFGESGIGKSILSKAVYGLLDPTRLSVTINEGNYESYLRETAGTLQENGFFVFQEPSSHLNPLIPLETQLGEGSLAQAGGEAAILRHLWDTTKDDAIRQILTVYPKPHRPSGGEKQRILLAMAFKKINLNQSKNVRGLYIFDEPTGSLDNNFRNLFLKLLFDKYRDQAFTSLIITHDYSMISEIYDSHGDLRKNVAFKELTDAESGLKMRDFEADAYLNWLKQEKSLPTFEGHGEDTILEMQSGYQIYGKRIRMLRKREDDQDVPLVIRRGEMVYLKAASGVGKTTLAKIIIGLARCTGLDLKLGNLHLTDKTAANFWKRKIWGKQVGMVFQHADEALNLMSNVRDVFKGLPSKDKITDEYIRQRLKDLFDLEVDNAFLKKKVKLLSGGQKQRLNLLRTLILDTDLIILDEPLNGLDFESIQRVIKLLQDKQREGKAILMISHNEEIFDALIPEENIYFMEAESS